MTFTVYSKPNCVYCDRAKTLITASGLTYEELIIDVGQVKDNSKTYVTVSDLKSRVPGASSVPQIFRGENYIGGFEALKKTLEVAA